MKAAIFDMDGLLVDSEKHWIGIDRTIWEELGLEVTEEFQKQLTGLNLKDAFALAVRYKSDLSWDEMIRKYDEAAVAIYTEKTQLLPGVIVLLKKLKEQEIPLGLASSSSIDWINIVLDRFNLQEFFTVKLSARTMNIPGKPRPDIYLQAMKLLNAEPDKSIVFEDSIHGVTAAKKAGAYTVAVPNPEWNSGDYSIADLVLQSLEDFNFSIIKN